MDIRDLPRRLGNSEVQGQVNHLQVQKAAATTWKERRARINTISPGIIVTPLAYYEFKEEPGYNKCPVSDIGKAVSDTGIRHYTGFI